MKKLAIITLIGDNCGNRLQNYALQEVFKTDGIKVETLDCYIRKEKTFINKLKNLIKFILSVINKKYKQERKRHKKFLKFNKKYVDFSKRKICNEHIPPNINKKYDYFICGSDQVWNTDYEQNGIVNFLGFVDKGKKSSYAASIGVKKIKSTRIDEIKKYINDLDNISIRENNSITILKEITSKKIRCDLDPTLLIPVEKWKKMESSPKNITINKPYALVYFLGKINDDINNLISRFSIELNVEVIDINNSNWYSSIGPREFLFLIDNATLIFTDSFHGTVFSLIYNKEFYVFQREGIGIEMEDRITNILEIVGLQNRLMKNDDVHVDDCRISYCEVKKKLDVEIKKSLKYVGELVELICR